nr:SGNH family hydrolase [Xanthobacter sp. YC-JY1]
MPVRPNPLALLLLALLTGVLLGADAARPAFAQNDFFFFLRPPANVPRGNPQPQQRQQQQQQQQRPPQNSGWWPFQPQPDLLPPPQQQAKPQAPAEPTGVVYGSADAASQGKRVPPSQFVLVLGDRMAGQLAQGLADSYVPERQRIAIVDNTVDESGFLPTPVDWLARLPDAIAAARPSVTVVALGSDDLQPIKDGDTQAQPLTERWNELYGKRVDEVLAALREKAGRIIVVGLAPVANGQLSDDYAKLNEILRARVARAGLTFANVWDGFVDEDGKYMANGPAVDGQRRRLRFNDGVRFTRAGGRKLAFFVQKDINRMLEESGGAKASPTPDATSGPERPSALAGAPATGRDARPDAVQVSTSAASAAKVLKDGVAPPPVRGRADDFTWPPSGAEPAAAPSAR